MKLSCALVLTLTNFVIATPFSFSVKGSGAAGQAGAVTVPFGTFGQVQPIASKTAGYSGSFSKSSASFASNSASSGSFTYNNAQTGATSLGYGTAGFATPDQAIGHNVVTAPQTFATAGTIIPAGTAANTESSGYYSSKDTNDFSINTNSASNVQYQPAVSEKKPSSYYGVGLTSSESHVITKPNDFVTSAVETEQSDKFKESSEQNFSSQTINSGPVLASPTTLIDGTPTVEKKLAYNGGFGGPPGVLKPYDKDSVAGNTQGSNAFLSHQPVAQLHEPVNLKPQGFVYTPVSTIKPSYITNKDTGNIEPTVQSFSSGSDYVTSNAELYYKPEVKPIYSNPNKPTVAHNYGGSYSDQKPIDGQLLSQQPYSEIAQTSDKKFTQSIDGEGSQIFVQGYSDNYGLHSSSNTGAQYDNTHRAPESPEKIKPTSGNYNTPTGVIKPFSQSVASGHIVTSTSIQPEQSDASKPNIGLTIQDSNKYTYTGNFGVTGQPPFESTNYNSLNSGSTSGSYVTPKPTIPESNSEKYGVAFGSAISTTSEAVGTANIATEQQKEQILSKPSKITSFNPAVASWVQSPTYGPSPLPVKPNSQVPEKPLVDISKPSNLPSPTGNSFVSYKPFGTPASFDKPNLNSETLVSNRKESANFGTTSDLSHVSTFSSAVVPKPIASVSQIASGTPTGPTSTSSSEQSSYKPSFESSAGTISASEFSESPKTSPQKYPTFDGGYTVSKETQKSASEISNAETYSTTSVSSELNSNLFPQKPQSQFNSNSYPQQPQSQITSNVLQESYESGDISASFVTPKPTGSIGSTSTIFSEKPQYNPSFESSSATDSKPGLSDNPKISSLQEGQKISSNAASTANVPSAFNPPKPQSQLPTSPTLETETQKKPYYSNTFGTLTGAVKPASNFYSPSYPSSPSNFGYQSSLVSGSNNKPKETIQSTTTTEYKPTFSGISASSFDTSKQTSSGSVSSLYTGTPASPTSTGISQQSTYIPQSSFAKGSVTGYSDKQKASNTGVSNTQKYPSVEGEKPTSQTLATNTAFSSFGSAFGSSFSQVKPQSNFPTVQTGIQKKPWNSNAFGTFGAVKPTSYSYPGFTSSFTNFGYGSRVVDKTKQTNQFTSTGQYKPTSTGQYNLYSTSQFKPTSTGQYNPITTGQYNPSSTGQYKPTYNWGFAGQSAFSKPSDQSTPTGGSFTSTYTTTTTSKPFVTSVSFDKLKPSTSVSVTDQKVSTTSGALGSSLSVSKPTTQPLSHESAYQSIYPAVSTASQITPNPTPSQSLYKPISGSPTLDDYSDTAKVSTTVAYTTPKYETEKPVGHGTQTISNGVIYLTENSESVISSGLEHQYSFGSVKPTTNVPTLESNVPTPSANVPKPSANVPTPSANVPTLSGNAPTPSANIPTPGQFQQDSAIFNAGSESSPGAPHYSSSELGLAHGSSVEFESQKLKPVVAVTPVTENKPSYIDINSGSFEVKPLVQSTSPNKYVENPQFTQTSKPIWSTQKESAYPSNFGLASSTLKPNSPSSFDNTNSNSNVIAASPTPLTLTSSVNSVEHTASSNAGSTNAGLSHFASGQQPNQFSAKIDSANTPVSVSSEQHKKESVLSISTNGVSSGYSETWNTNPTPIPAEQKNPLISSGYGVLSQKQSSQSFLTSATYQGNTDVNPNSDVQSSQITKWPIHPTSSNPNKPEYSSSLSGQLTPPKESSDSHTPYLTPSASLANSFGAVSGSFESKPIGQVTTVSGSQYQPSNLGSSFVSSNTAVPYKDDSKLSGNRNEPAQSLQNQQSFYKPTLITGSVSDTQKVSPTVIPTFQANPSISAESVYDSTKPSGQGSWGYNVQQGAFQSKPNIKVSVISQSSSTTVQSPYVGGFGGPSGILKPNDFSVPTNQAHTLSQYNTEDSNATPYAGGFGGPLGVLKPNKNEKHSSFGHSVHNQYSSNLQTSGFHGSVTGSTVHPSLQASPTQVNAKGQTVFGVQATTGSQTNTAATASAGGFVEPLVGGHIVQNPFNSGASSGTGFIKNSGTFSGQFGGSNGFVSGASIKGSSGAGTSSIGFGKSFASNTPTALVSAGLLGQNGYGR